LARCQDYPLDLQPLDGVAPAPVVRRYSQNHDVHPFIGLLLVSGWASGGGWFHRLASALSDRDGIEVWVLERREVFLEERSFLNSTEDHPPPLSEEKSNILQNLSLASLCRDLVFAIGEMRTMGAESICLGGWSATGLLVSSFLAFESDDGQTGLDLVDGIIGFDSPMVCAQRVWGERLLQRVYNGYTYDSSPLEPIIRLERAAREGRLRAELDVKRRDSKFARLYSIAFGDDCSEEVMNEVYLGPARPHEWYFPIRYYADTYILHGRDWVWPEEHFVGFRNRTCPALIVLAHSMDDTPSLSKSVEYFVEKVSGESTEIIQCPNLSHAGILVADAAIESVFGPVENWLKGIGLPE